MVVVYPENVWYAGVTSDDLPEIFESHLRGGKPVERLIYRPAGPGSNVIAKSSRQPSGVPPVRDSCAGAASFIPTLRDDPADAEAASHRLMVRAGLVRQLTAGVYVYLPLGQRVIDRVNAIIREEMNRIGGQEITMPVLHPAELWQQSGRWYDIKDEMFRLKDRHGRDMCLGMTHEEVVAWLASKEIRSYRELPRSGTRFQTKERDEARPRSGVLRTREFWMKDAYTLDVDEAGLAGVRPPQGRLCADLQPVRLRLPRGGVRSRDDGRRGAHEFMAPSAAGEDEIALCDALRLRRQSRAGGITPVPCPVPRRSPRGGARRRDVRTIADVAPRLGVSRP